MIDLGAKTAATTPLDTLSPALRRASAPASPLAALAPLSAAGDATTTSQESGFVAGGHGTAPSREPGLQQQLGRLQQGLDYLDRLAQTLQGLKSSLSRSLAQGQATAALPQQVSQLTQLWQQRSQQAGGRVDSQLQASTGDEPARQRFKLRGLDLSVLERGGAETLRLQLPGRASSQGTAMTLSVTLDGEGTESQLQTLARALAPAGLSVDAQGQDLVFSVAESQWPALRDGLTVRGDGKRFPSGQPVRARLDAAPEALQPQQWNVSDAIGQRQALGQVLQAQPRLARAREALGEQLRDVQNQTEPVSGLNAGEAQALAGGLESRLSQGDYAMQQALMPALRGLHRQRVRQLLG
ncbi:MAG: hypothetical protein DI603_02360 [Roseateles depolymerans]|uniref:Uncharacterized protein n=1 Tax=Roseateles depolymerans TaxID=76731 RepID=A0A2W5DUR4_9BURK|nr:MAG: hypothetical protein DI603_02360 [Roseateles depolymerans]